MPGAKSYRFTVVPAKGVSLVFAAEKPWAPLSPVWTKVPTGTAILTVTGLDAQGMPVGEPMERTFHRAAVIGKEYPAPAMPWRESARMALDALVHSQDMRCWFTIGEPDPEGHLYRYPSKNVGAAAAALAIYADQVPPPAGRRTTCWASVFRPTLPWHSARQPTILRCMETNSRGTWYPDAV